MQEIDSRAITQAILDARWRGVRVQVFWSRTICVATWPEPAQAPSTQSRRDCRGGVAADPVAHRPHRPGDQPGDPGCLVASDLEVKGDYHPKIFHQRFILGDHDGKATPTSALLSGSANLPWTDTHSNLNNVVVFHNAYVCRQYQAEVEQLQRAASVGGCMGRSPAPMTFLGCRCGCCSPPITPRSWIS